VGQGKRADHERDEAGQNFLSLHDDVPIPSLC